MNDTKNRTLYCLPIRTSISSSYKPRICCGLIGGYATLTHPHKQLSIPSRSDELNSAEGSFIRFSLLILQSDSWRNGLNKGAVGQATIFEITTGPSLPVRQATWTDFQCVRGCWPWGTSCRSWSNSDTWRRRWGTDPSRRQSGGRSRSCSRNLSPRRCLPKCMQQKSRTEAGELPKLFLVERWQVVTR